MYSSSLTAGTNVTKAQGTRWASGNAVLVWGFVALGIVFRLRQYVYDRSLWLDECLLVINIIHRSPAELLKPLSHGQAAPIGFLLLEKMVVDHLGSSEMALRLVPFLSGVVSLFVFAAVAQRLLKAKEVPIAVGLFALSGGLIYYSSEAKQYSTDVAVVLVLYLLAVSLLETELGGVKILVASAIGSLAVWFSQPAVFVLAGIGLSVVWASVQKNDRRFLLLFSIPVAAWTFSFLAYYFFSLRGLTHSSFLLGYWQGSFVPLLPHSLKDVRWFADTFFNVFSDPLGLTFTGIAGVAAIAGARDLFSTRQSTFFLLLLPIVLTFLASGFHRYPFRGRLLLFLVPSAILLIAAGLGTIQRKTHDAIPLLGVLLVSFLFLYPAADACRQLFKPQTVEEIRPVIAYVDKHRSEGDILYCYYASRFALDYYTQRGLLSPQNQIIGVESRQNPQSYREDLGKLSGRGRVWFLFSHVYRDGGIDEEQFYVDYLDGTGRRLDSSFAPGASVYLYDMSTQRSR